MADNALSLIKELTEENERLRADKDYWKSRAKESESEYNQAVKRGYNLGAIDYVGSFAERLKAETITIQDHTGKLGSVVLVGTIDQIAKEMVNDCTQCKHFVGCECFDGKTCTKFEKTKP
jgi:hypothetical protein